MHPRKPAALLAVLFVVTASAACQPKGDGTIETVFDPCEPLVLAPEEAATEAQRESVREGAALWNELAGAQLVIAGDDDAPAAPVVPVRFETAAPLFLGLYDDVEGEVLINRTLEPARARTVTVAHEVGHAFGLLHVVPAERTSVMNTGNTDVDPTDEDIAELRALWGACEPAASP